MASKKDDAEIISLVQETYVPFLKKLIAFLEKNKKATPDNLSRLKTIYTIFTTGSTVEKLETFRANEAKLKNWYNKAQKEKTTEDGESAKGSKRSIVLSDTESSQGGLKMPKTSEHLQEFLEKQTQLLEELMGQHGCSEQGESKAKTSTERVREFRERQNQLRGQNKHGGKRRDTGRPKRIKIAIECTEEYRQRIEENHEHRIENNDLCNESIDFVPEILQSSTKKRCTFTNSVDSASVQSTGNTNQNSTSNLNATQIKKEKIESPVVTQAMKAFKTTPTIAPAPPPPQPEVSTPATAPSVSSGDEPIVFTCASCQFQTQEETEFMKHARTDHRTDLSMWCKHCGKCFSNAGVLVSHIKERACIKEEMIYKCGVKDCVFETTSGQTFVHHLRHCHKGSPFIFCVHCQKIFTLPHCLILHMQDDCPFKERNRKNPGAVTSSTQAGSRPQPPPQSTLSQTKGNTLSNAVSILQAQAQVNRSVTPKPPIVLSPPVIRAPVRPPVQVFTPTRGRGRGVSRGRGRGRGRAPFSDSSDSDDPDDPSWRPEEMLGEQNLRRSGRWAKKINDVMNPEPSSSGVTIPPAKKSFTDADMNKKMISCPSCDFMAVFQSVLEDHYIANHKVPNKNACLVCHLKFENIRSFFDHFEDHRSGLLPNKPPSEVMEEARKQASKQTAESEIVSLETENESLPNTTKYVEEPFDGVLTSIVNVNLVDPTGTGDPLVKGVKIPYQAAIHDKNLKDSKLKKFEELKSLSDLNSMKSIQKLSHFFKCALYNCTFSTHSAQEFSEHLQAQHEGKRFHCCYCLTEELNSAKMTSHIAFKHKDRLYQCSKCFYRAYSKAHCQIHIKNCHSEDSYTEILVCEPVQLPDTPHEEESSEVLNTTWPYICAIGECGFNTFDPKEFKKHNDTAHRLVSVFFCHYCKVDFLTFKRLMNHYRLHGLNVFQCNYCIHGAETKEEILLHLSSSHADEPLKAYMRGSEEEASSEVKQLNSVIREETGSTKVTDMTTIQKNSEENAVQNSAVDTFIGFENELYHIVDNKCYPKNMQSMYFPRYLKDILVDIVCGIPFCNEKFETLNLYLSHLRKVHDALNYSCPYCPEIYDLWKDFKNHLLCHGSKLYACGFKDCEYYNWNKDKVKEHKKEHALTDNGVVALREYVQSNEESKLMSFDPEVEFPCSNDPLFCLFCKYKSNNRNIMKNHIYQEIAYQRFDCSLCEKRCLSRKEIKDHFIVTHPELDILCSADYNLEIESMVKFLLNQPQKFQDVKLAESCDMCCKKIKNALRLQSHLLICLNKEYLPYECQHCKKKFVNLLALKYHTDNDHHPQSVETSVQSNYAIEADISKNLLKIRSKQLRDAFEENSIELDVNDKSYKFYTCSDCVFEAHHKFNVERHNELKHDNKAKVMKGQERNPDAVEDLNCLEENSNDSISSKGAVKRFSCGFCLRKMLTIQEVEMHVKKSHSAKNADFFYYYTPNTTGSYLEKDVNIYECAYCKSTRENLVSLKKHADIMHSEMEFRVKGFITFTHTHNDYLACGYCYMKADSSAQLQEHSKSAHPLLALKSIGGFQVQAGKNKRHGETDDIPNKRVKFSSAVFVCSHCGGAFSSEEAVKAHSKKAHSRFQLKYTKKNQSVNSAELTDFKFYKCEFCKFTAEKHFLDKHLASKHKMRVTCSYCSKRFEFASRLKEHNDVFHKDLPLKYIQETVNLTTPSSNNTNENEQNKTTNIPEPVSKNKENSEPVDLQSLTVHMKTNDGQSAELPLVYVTERFNMFPKVVLTDCRKEDDK